MLEDGHTQRRRKIGRLSVPVDVRKKLRDCGVLLRGDGFDLRPKCVFEADARLVTLTDRLTIEDFIVACPVPLEFLRSKPEIDLWLYRGRARTRAPREPEQKDQAPRPS